MNRCFALLFGLFVAALSQPTWGQEPLPVIDESAKYDSNPILTRLDNPWGIAVRPSRLPDSSKEIFFAESGAGCVRRFTLDSPGTSREVIKGLEVQEVDEQFPVRTGPRALGFLTPTKLAVVGGNGEQVEVYSIPDGESLAADKYDYLVGPLSQEGQPANLAFQSCTITETAAFFAVGDFDEGGTIFKSALKANRLDELQPLVRAAEAKGWGTVAGLCISDSSRMQFLVAGYVGTLLGKRDSQLVFIAPQTGKLVTQFATELCDIVGLIYSPSGQLYAVDLSWKNTSDGGIYRIDDARSQGRPACQVVKIASVAHPTSAVFVDKETLVVTAIGRKANQKQGSITKLTGNF